MTVPALVEEGREAIRAINAAGITARLIGGIAVWLRSPAMRERASLQRPFGDIDVVAKSGPAREIIAALEMQGWTSREPFNTTHGHSRLEFSSGSDHLDVFIGKFHMCHTLDLRGRLTINEETVSAADLLLTKLQIAELNRKDVGDAIALLLDTPVTTDERGLNKRWITDVLSSDWGWWRTATENLDRVEAGLGEFGLAESDHADVAERIGELRDDVARAPKGLKWRTRAKLGDRIPWRDMPEEVGQATP